MVEMMMSVSEHAPAAACAAAAITISATLAGKIAEGGSSALVSMAGALNIAADFKGPAIKAISNTLIEVGKHLPFIGIAVGALGFMLVAFEDSKEQDENLKMIVVWMTGVGEWLSLISAKIDDAASDNTIEMFQMLNDAIEGLREVVDKWKNKRGWTGRFSKMFSAGAFKASFEDTKEVVNLLKTALRDLLDQEQQDRQEELLRDNNKELKVLGEKIDDGFNAVDKQLEEMKNMLVTMAETNAGNALTLVGTRGEQLFNMFRHMLGQDVAAQPVGGTIPFAQFKMAYENKFHDGKNNTFIVLKSLSSSLFLLSVINLTLFFFLFSNAPHRNANNEKTRAWIKVCIG